MMIPELVMMMELTRGLTRDYLASARVMMMCLPPKKGTRPQPRCNPPRGFPVNAFHLHKFNRNPVIRNRIDHMAVNSPAWGALQQHYDATMKDQHMRQLFAGDAGRFEKFSAEEGRC